MGYFSLVLNEDIGVTVAILMGLIASLFGLMTLYLVRRYFTNLFHRGFSFKKPSMLLILSFIIYAVARFVLLLMMAAEQHVTVLGLILPSNIYLLSSALLIFLWVRYANELKRVYCGEAPDRWLRVPAVFVLALSILLIIATQLCPELKDSDRDMCENGEVGLDATCCFLTGVALVAVSLNLKKIFKDLSIDELVSSTHRQQGDYMRRVVGNQGEQLNYTLTGGGYGGDLMGGGGGEDSQRSSSAGQTSSSHHADSAVPSSLSAHPYNASPSSYNNSIISNHGAINSANYCAAQHHHHHHYALNAAPTASGNGNSNSQSHNCGRGRRPSSSREGGGGIAPLLSGHDTDSDSFHGVHGGGSRGDITTDDDKQSTATSASEFRYSSGKLNSLSPESRNALRAAVSARPRRMRLGILFFGIYSLFRGPGILAFNFTGNYFNSTMSAGCVFYLAEAIAMGISMRVLMGPPLTKKASASAGMGGHADGGAAAGGSRRRESTTTSPARRSPAAPDGGRSSSKRGGGAAIITISPSAGSSRRQQSTINAHPSHSNRSSTSPRYDSNRPVMAGAGPATASHHHYDDYDGDVSPVDSGRSNKKQKNGHDNRDRNSHSNRQHHGDGNNAGEGIGRRSPNTAAVAYLEGTLLNNSSTSGGGGGGGNNPAMRRQGSFGLGGGAVNFLAGGGDGKGVGGKAQPSPRRTPASTTTSPSRVGGSSSSNRRVSPRGSALAPGRVGCGGSAGGVVVDRGVSPTMSSHHYATTTMTNSGHPHHYPHYPAINSTHGGGGGVLTRNNYSFGADDDAQSMRSRQGSLGLGGAAAAADTTATHLQTASSEANALVSVEGGTPQQQQHRRGRGGSDAHTLPPTSFRDVGGVDGDGDYGEGDRHTAARLQQKQQQHVGGLLRRPTPVENWAAAGGGGTPNPSQNRFLLDANNSAVRFNSNSNNSNESFNNNNNGSNVDSSSTAPSSENFFAAGADSSFLLAAGHHQHNGSNSNAAAVMNGRGRRASGSTAAPTPVASSRRLEIGDYEAATAAAEDIYSQ